MKLSTVVLAGGTGFVGRFFEKHFKQMGYKVIIISRRQGHIPWSDKGAIVNALNGSKLLVNLAGKSVDCRYNEKNKREIFSSRTETTRLLGEALIECEQPPELWINSSTATIYRHALDRPMTEEQGEIGEGFSVEVAKKWEQTFFSFSLPETRQVALRISIVLGKDGGVITPFKHLVKFRLGGVQGKGNQKFSFIHIEDLFRIVLFLMERNDLNGVFNCSTPNPVTNRELMEHFRKVMNVKWGMPTPAWMLELGAIFIRTETELILKSRWVIPDRLVKAGFTFKYETIDQTLRNIIRKN